MCFNASCSRLWHVSCISLSHRNRHISAFRAQRRKTMKYFLICSFLTVVRYPCIFPSAGSSEFQTSGCTAVETVCVCVCDLPWPPAWPRPSCWLLNVPSELLKLVNQCVEVEERWQLCSLAPPACTRYSLHMCFCFLSPNEKNHIQWRRCSRETLSSWNQPLVCLHYCLGRSEGGDDGARPNPACVSASVYNSDVPAVCPCDVQWEKNVRHMLESLVIEEDL